MLAIGGRLRRLVEAEAKAAARMELDDLTAQRFIQRMRDAAARRSPRQAALPIPEDLEAAKAAIRRERAAELAEHAERCGNLAKIKAAIELLQPRFLRPLDELDADPWRLAAKNGVIDLRRAAEPRPEAEDLDELVERRRSWLSPPDRLLRNTRTLGVNFDPAADCPKFRDFVELIMPDRVMRG